MVTRLGWVAVACCLAYWLAYALAAPVTTTDSQFYNLARLLIAEREGLFGNDLWTSYHQTIFPWSFDAVHYPFVKLGALETLPSFLCLAGICVIAWLQCLRAGAPGWAPFAVLALLASPTVVLQATATKNDLAVAFFAVAAFHFLEIWRGQPEKRLALAGGVVSLGLCAGAKTTGLVIVAVLFAGMAWACRKAGIRRLVEFAAGSALAILLLGSVETYVNNRLLYGEWMGAAGFIAAHGNPDGVSGALASLIRYAFNSCATGLESKEAGAQLSRVLAAACDSVLGALGLRQTGLSEIQHGPGFAISCYEISSTYGVVGFIAVPVALVALCRERLRTPAGRLAAIGFVVLAILCFCAGWKKYNMRLLLPAAVPLLLSASLFVAAAMKVRPARRLGVGICLALFAAAVPFFAGSRQPMVMVAALSNRDAVIYRERPLLRIERDGVALLARELQPAGCAVIINRDDWVLPYLRDPVRRWSLVPNKDNAPEIAEATIRHYLPPGASGRWLVVASQHAADVRLPASARLLGRFPGQGRAYLMELPPQ